MAATVAYPSRPRPDRKLGAWLLFRPIPGEAEDRPPCPGDGLGRGLDLRRKVDPEARELGDEVAVDRCLPPGVAVGGLHLVPGGEQPFEDRPGDLSALREGRGVGRETGQRRPAFVGRMGGGRGDSHARGRKGRQHAGQTGNGHSQRPRPCTRHHGCRRSIPTSGTDIAPMGSGRKALRRTGCSPKTAVAAPGPDAMDIPEIEVGRSLAEQAPDVRNRRSVIDRGARSGDGYVGPGLPNGPPRCREMPTGFYRALSSRWIVTSRSSNV